MDSRQRAAAHALLRAAAERRRLPQGHDIMRLEEVLRAIEKVRRFDRDPDNYAWIVFGDPEAGAPGAGESKGTTSRSTSRSPPARPDPSRPPSWGRTPLAYRPDRSKGSAS